MKAAETASPAVVFMTADHEFHSEIESLLDGFGYRLLIANSFDVLIVMLKGERPKLVLMDLDVPTTPKGIRATTTHLQEETKLGEVPIVYISIERELKSVSESLLLGRNEYIIR